MLCFSLHFTSSANHTFHLTDSEDSTFAKPKFIFGFDSRRSIIESKPARIFGLRIGLQHRNQKYRYGLGLYNMQEPLIRLNENVEELNEPIDSLNIDFGYLALFYERIWINEKKYEVTTPFVLGLGGVDRSYRDQNGTLIKLPVTNISLLEFGVASHYKFTPWVGLGAGFGYNVVLSGRPELSRAFNSPFYVFKVKLFLGELYRLIRKKKAA